MAFSRFASSLILNWIFSACLLREFICELSVISLRPTNFPIDCLHRLTPRLMAPSDHEIKLLIYNKLLTFLQSEARLIFLTAPISYLMSDLLLIELRLLDQTSLIFSKLKLLVDAFSSTRSLFQSLLPIFKGSQIETLNSSKSDQF